MRYAHTVEQVRTAEQTLMSLLPPGTLMQRAAVGLASACVDYLGGVYGARVLVLAGSGDNGGDALYAGAHLARRGAAVQALPLSSRVHTEGCAALRRAGGRILDTAADAKPADLVVDGIVGIGGKPGLRDPAAEIVAGLSAPIVAVDTPSGISVDTGETPAPHVRAQATVTFGTHKIGHFVAPGAAAAGGVELVDIGLAPYLPEAAVEVLQPSDVARLLSSPGYDAHKYTRGVVGIRAGSPGYTGAGVLVAGAAVATGLAGMVRYEGASADLIRVRHPEVVIGPGRVQSWVVGSGLGADCADVVRDVLSHRQPTVIDADGLYQLPDHLTGPAVLTPHAGELAAMLDVPRSEVAARALTHAREAAHRWNAVVLLKGPHSLIAAPDRRVRVNPTGVSWLATAGSGDVLSGVIGALLATGLSPYDAASVGAYLHGAAGTLAADHGSLSASDLLTTVPRVVRRSSSDSLTVA